MSKYKTLEAWRKVLCVIGGQYKERWPNEEYRILFLVDVFTYSQRITALTFLFGNLRDVPRVQRRAPAARRRPSRPTT